MTRHDYPTVGPRADAEPTDGLPVLMLGRDRVPPSCAHCGASSFEPEPPLGRHAFGRLACGTCSRQAAWLSAPLLPVAAVSSTRAVSVVERPLIRTTFTRVDGCGPACSAYYGHDAATHEQRGYARALDELRPPAGGIVRTGRLAVDLDQRVAEVDGRAIHLTINEYSVLAAMAARAGRISRHAEIVATCWGLDELALCLSRGRLATARWHALRVVIGRLRARLGPGCAWLIETVPSSGYRLRAVPPDPLPEA